MFVADLKGSRMFDVEDKGLTVNLTAIISFGISLCVTASISFAVIDDITVLKISPHDQRAVIKMQDGKAQLIKPGDLIGGKYGKVAEIANDRIVVEQMIGKEAEIVIIRLEKGKQRMERIKKTR